MVTAEEKNRLVLLLKLRQYSEAPNLDPELKAVLKLAEVEIVELYDRIRFDVVDRVSTKVRRAVLQALEDETGFEAHTGNVTVEDDSFSFTAHEHMVSGRRWLVEVTMEEADND